MDLVRSEQVSFDVAKAAANNPSDFDLKMNVFGSSSSGLGDGAMAQSGLAEEMNNVFRSPGR
jgi:hypothetical protein